jgi:very-short-patch-repair endonuclease
LEQADQLERWAGPSVPELLDRYPRRAGTPKLRQLATQPLAITRSELEARFLYMLGDWGLPRPHTNLVVAGFEVDCVWPEHGLIVELDGFAIHGTRLAFETDRRRDRALQAARWTVIRITWRQLAEEPERIRADLARLLG